jgi:hypothetical protein
MSAADPGTYRDRLAALAAGGIVERHLDAWAGERGLEPLGWRREYGRFRPGRSEWAVLAYAAEAGGLTVRVDLCDRVQEVDGRELRSDDLLGWLAISDCRDDPALPGLGLVLDALDDAAVVRYRPGNRCTVRGGAGEGARFVKVVNGVPDRQVDARALWTASQDGAFGFAVAEPHGWDLRTSSSWYGVVAGDPVAPAVLGPGGAAMAVRLGAALGELARAPVHPGEIQEHTDQLARTGRAVGRAAAAAPALADRLERVVDVLARLHDDFTPRPLVPVHGSPHMHQWLQSNRGRLGLVDFDRFALGEPELDLATFLVELESESDRAVAMPDLEQALALGFEAVAGRLDETRLAVYAVHKRLAKVARTACGMRPDGAARAERHLDALADDLVDLDRRSSRQLA